MTMNEEKKLEKLIKEEPHFNDFKLEKVLVWENNPTAFIGVSKGVKYFFVKPKNGTIIASQTTDNIIKNMLNNTITIREAFELYTTRKFIFLYKPNEGQYLLIKSFIIYNDKVPRTLLPTEGIYWN